MTDVWMCVCGHNRSTHEIGGRQFCRYTGWEPGGRTRCNCSQFTPQFPPNPDKET